MADRSEATITVAELRSDPAAGAVEWPSMPRAPAAPASHGMSPSELVAWTCREQAWPSRSRYFALRSDITL